MRGEHLFEAITNIDAKFVEEANPATMKPRRKKPAMLYRYGAIAAMLVFAIGISALVLESGVLFSKSEEAMPAAEEATAYGLEAAAEEEEYEECAIEEAAAEEPAAEPAPAEAAIVTQETAAPEAPAEAPAEDVAEAPAAEEAEAFTEGEAMASRMIPDTVIRYNGTAYEPADQLLDALPEGCEEAGAVSGAADAVWYAEDVALHGAVVWQPDSGEDVFYVELKDGYLTYWRAP